MELSCSRPARARRTGPPTTAAARHAAVDRLLEGHGQQRPVVLDVERQDDPVERQALGELPVRGGRQRVGVDVVEQLPDALRTFVDGLAQDAVALLHAVLEVGAQGSLEPLGLSERELLVRQRRVDRPVEHHPSYVLGEEVGVGGAQEGAVRRAEVVELPLAQRGPQDVHVLRRLDRGDVPGQVATLGETTLPELAGEPIEAGHLVGGVGVRVGTEELVGLLRAGALERSALPDSSGVDADDVEVADQLLAEAERNRRRRS